MKIHFDVLPCCRAANTGPFIPRKITNPVGTPSIHLSYIYHSSNRIDQVDVLGGLPKKNVFDPVENQYVTWLNFV